MSTPKTIWARAQNRHFYFSKGKENKPDVGCWVDNFPLAGRSCPPVSLERLEEYVRAVVVDALA